METSASFEARSAPLPYPTSSVKKIRNCRTSLHTALNGLEAAEHRPACVRSGLADNRIQAPRPCGPIMLVLFVLLVSWVALRGIGAAGVHALASWQDSARYALVVMF